MTTSLIIATYNWPRALYLCLESVMRQTVMPGEILIADDGSRMDTRDVVDHFASISPVPIRHIWHEDTGFRLAAIRNKAIAASCGEYIIQIDGDIILERHFIEDHIDFARPGYFAGGTRALLNAKLTRKMLDGEKISLHALRPGIENSNTTMRIYLLSLLFVGYHPNKEKGCNMAFWRNDLLAANGYDESFEGWGYEDSELADRLRNRGLTKRTIRFQGIAFHLSHPNASRDSKAQNVEIRLRSKREQRLRCDKGLDQYITK